MGSQQLILLVLIVIIVGVGVQIGMRSVESFQQTLERDGMVKHMTFILADAKKYFAKPPHIGGGGGTFAGYTPLPSAQSEQYDITFTTGSGFILFQGYGTMVGWDGATPVQVVAEYQSATDEWRVTDVN